MPATKVIKVLRERIARVELEALTDAVLLQRFLASRDDHAFATLVQRHAGMVWGVCVRTLNHLQDAEDAFQATFLVLFRKAAAIQPPGMLANWLYGVAQQIAVKARAMNAKRKVREKPMAETLVAAPNEPERWSDLRPILDQELSLLPDKYRAVIVLCDLLGKTRSEAATQLGVPDGTIAGRLARARVMLGKRLARRGIALSIGALAATIAQGATAAAPFSVVSATLQATGGNVSAPVAALVEGVIHTMLLAKLKSTATSILVILGLFALGFGALATGTSGRDADDAIAQPQPAPVAQAKPVNEKKAPEPQKPPVVNELDKLQGSWRIKTGTFREGEVWTIQGNSLRERPDEKFVRFIRLRAEKSPKEIDIIVQAHPDGPILTEERGIYELDGDTLKLFMRVGARPASFPKTQELNEVLILERVPPKPAPPPEKKVVEEKSVRLKGQRVDVLAFAPDGKTLVSTQASSSEFDTRYIRILDLDLKELHVHAHEAHMAQFLGFGADGKPLALRPLGTPRNVSEVKQLELFEVGSDRKRALLDHGYCNAAALSPDGKTLALVRGGISLFDSNNGGKLAALPHEGLYHQLMFSADSKTLAVSSHHGMYTIDKVASVHVVDLTTRRTKAIHTAPSLEFDRHNKSLRLRSPNGFLNQRLFDFFAKVKQRKGEEWSPYQGALAPDGRTLALIWRPHQYYALNERLPGRIHLVDLDTGKDITNLQAQDSDFTAVAFSPDSKLLAAGDDAGNVRLWNLTAVQPAPARPRPISFSEDKGYEWRGVFPTDDAKKRVFLCNPPKLSERIELTDKAAALVLKDWDKHRDRIVECYSRKDETPLDLYLLVEPKKADTKPPAKVDDAADLINQIFSGFDPKKTYVGPSVTYLIQGDKKTPLHGVVEKKPIEPFDRSRIRGPVTIEFTGGGVAWVPEISPGGGFQLSSYWEYPPVVNVRVSGWEAMGMRLPEKGAEALVGTRLRVSGEMIDGKFTFNQKAGFHYLGVDQSWVAAQKEFKTVLQGKWNSIDRPKIEMIILQGGLVRGNVTNFTMMRIDPTKTPKEVDFFNSGNGQPRPAIYKIDGDILVLALGDYGEPRPKGFTAKEGGGNMQHYRRDPTYKGPDANDQLLEQLLRGSATPSVDEP